MTNPVSQQDLKLSHNKNYILEKLLFVKTGNILSMNNLLLFIHQSSLNIKHVLCDLIIQSKPNLVFTIKTTCLESTCMKTRDLCHLWQRAAHVHLQRIIVYKQFLRSLSLYFLYMWVHMSVRTQQMSVCQTDCISAVQRTLPELTSKGRLCSMVTFQKQIVTKDKTEFR